MDSTIPNGLGTLLIHTCICIMIDIEFVGKSTTPMQSNYFSRQNWRVDPNMFAGSGVEANHDLGFDASERFHSYSFRWAS